MSGLIRKPRHLVQASKTSSTLGQPRLPFRARLRAGERRIEALRARSEIEKKRKPAEIMDVNAGTVESLLRAHGYPRLIHGHTHRPARHEHRVDGRVCERWVLPDWYESGGVLVCDEKGCRAEKL